MPEETENYEVIPEGDLDKVADRNLPVLASDSPYVGVANGAFSPEAIEILLAPLADSEVELRPDGLVYLPEIKYRRILNKAFGPGAWSMMPLDYTVDKVQNMMYYRGALFAHGRFVAEAIGEQQYFESNDRMSYATAAESAKSNCLMRCCKDLGIASELWEPNFVKRWLAEYAIEVWCKNKSDGKKRKMWRKLSSPPVDQYPWEEEPGQGRRQQQSGGSNGKRDYAAEMQQAEDAAAPAKRQWPARPWNPETLREVFFEFVKKSEHRDLREPIVLEERKAVMSALMKAFGELSMEIPFVNAFLKFCFEKGSIVSLFPAQAGAVIRWAENDPAMAHLEGGIIEKYLVENLLWERPEVWESEDVAVDGTEDY